MAKAKRPKGTTALAKSIVDIATVEQQDKTTSDAIKAAAATLGRKVA